MARQGADSGGGEFAGLYAAPGPAGRGVQIGHSAPIAGSVGAKLPLCAMPGVKYH